MHPYGDKNQVQRTKTVSGGVTSVPISLIPAHVLSKCGSLRVIIWAQFGGISSSDGELSH